MNVNLKGQVALVTGAARGIGRAIADTFAANGAHVVYADIELDEKAMGAAADAKGCSALRMDVSDAAQVERGIGVVLGAQGRLDILVNNAGINTLHHRVNIDQFPLDEWHRILGVDLTGLFYTSRAGARPMLRQK